MNTEELKPCPFCGNSGIELNIGGTQFDIFCNECGISNGVQVCDYMTREERGAAIFDIDKYNGYEPMYRDRAVKAMVDAWNTRA